jgi:hypothetical protein
MVVRYEELAASGDGAKRLVEFLDRPMTPKAQSYIHAKSLQRWKADRWYGFQLDPEVERLALSFGYAGADLQNRTFPLWEPYRILSHVGPQSLSRRWRVLRRLLRNRLFTSARQPARG